MTLAQGTGIQGGEKQDSASHEWKFGMNICLAEWRLGVWASDQKEKKKKKNTKAKMDIMRLCPDGEVTYLVKRASNSKDKVCKKLSDNAL